MKALWIELKRFIKDKVILIIIGSLIISALYTVGMALFNRGAPDLEEDDLVGMEVADNNHDSAYFYFYVENQDGTGFTNTSILETYFRFDSTLEEVSAQTNVPIYDIINTARENAENTREAEEEILLLERNDYSMMFGLFVNTGNKNDNLAVASYYRDMIEGGGVPFLENKDVFVLVEPQIVEDDMVEEADVETTSSVSIRSLILSAVVGLILGMVIMLGGTIVVSLFSKKLNYSFTYTWNEEDQFLLSDPRLKNEDEVSQLMQLPLQKGKVLLLEDGVENKLKETVTNMKPNVIEQKNSLADINVNESVTEVIIVIATKSTSRAWYRKQRRLLEAYEVPVKVIQTN